MHSRGARPGEAPPLPSKVRVVVLALAYIYIGWVYEISSAVVEKTQSAMIRPPVNIVLSVPIRLKLFMSFLLRLAPDTVGPDRHCVPGSRGG